MHIAIDVREACSENRTGKGQWVFGLVSELLRRGIEIAPYSNKPLPASWNDKLQQTVQMLPGEGIGWHFKAAAHLRQRKDIDLYVSPTSYIVPSLLRGRLRCVTIVHDLIAFREERHDFKAKWIERLTLGRALASSLHVCTISEATRRDLLGRYPRLSPASVTSIYAGPMRDSVPLNVPDAQTILSIGTLCPRKNQLSLVKAYAMLPQELRSQFQLLLAGGRGWGDKSILSLLSQTDGAKWRGYIDESEYERLLSSCTVFALPSHYEGFGMQILDALQRGIPVLTSDRGSLREVCEDAALYVDPTDVESIMRGLVSLLSKPQLCIQLREKALIQAKKFSWQRTLDLFLKAIENIRYA